MLCSIDYLHKHNLSHREISPRHFLVNEQFQIMLSDLNHLTTLNDQMTVRQTQALVRKSTCPEVYLNKLPPNGSDSSSMQPVDVHNITMAAIDFNMSKAEYKKFTD
jgi:hypothetical protein